jgi:predicted enzyme related to lactoylglutathione lyase
MTNYPGEMSHEQKTEDVKNSDLYFLLRDRALSCYAHQNLSERAFMLRKIDCVMIRVEDIPTATSYYTEVFGLHPVWWDEHSTGLAFPETDAELVLHDKPDIPSAVEVHYLVDDVSAAVEALAAKGCRILAAPFDVAIGKCAVIADPFGTRLCLLDMTRGPLKPGPQ